MGDDTRIEARLNRVDTRLHHVEKGVTNVAANVEALTQELRALRAATMARFDQADAVRAEDRRSPAA